MPIESSRRPIASRSSRKRRETPAARPQDHRPAARRSSARTSSMFGQRPDALGQLRRGLRRDAVLRRFARDVDFDQHVRTRCVARSLIASASRSESTLWSISKRSIASGDLVASADGRSRCHRGATPRDAQRRRSSGAPPARGSRRSRASPAAYAARDDIRTVRLRDADQRYVIRAIARRARTLRRHAREHGNW